MKKYLLFLVLSISFGLHAQTLIKGRVVDEKTGETIPGVSIYVNNTTIGTITDAEGKFILNVPFKGTIELVSSYVTYEKKVTILEGYSGKDMVISLKPQNNTLSEVVIKSTKGDDFEKWGGLFKKLLLGNDLHFVNNCKIVNPEVLVFYLDKRTNDLSVYAKSSLVIENSMTGYRVKLDFDNFTYNFNSEILVVNYSTFFEEMKTSNATRASINASRRLAFYGSQMHFLRTVFNNTTFNNGYKVYVFKSIKNKEKERVFKVVQERTKEANVQYTVNYDLKKLFKNADTAQYYTLILKQDDVSSADTTITAIRRYTKLNRSLDVVNFSSTDTLMINYQPYLDANNKTITPELMSKWQAQNPAGKSKGETTIMYFINPAGANIQSTGYYPEENLFYYGKMFDKRISQILPWNYDPDQ